MNRQALGAPWGLHWFRRDLRVAGNPALQWNFKKNSGRVVGVFSFDSKFLAREDFSHDRFQFFLKTLEALRDELRSLGSDLLVLDAGPDEAFLKLSNEWKRTGAAPVCVTFNRDYEPFARDRDQRVMKFLEQKAGVPVHTERDHLLIEPHEVLKPGGGANPYYQIFTPFKRRWLDVFQTDEVQSRVTAQKSGLKYLKKGEAGKPFSLTWKDLGVDFVDALSAMIEKNGKKVSVPIPEAGSRVAYRKLQDFIEKHAHYADRRDIPSVAGTSQLSIYLKNGSLTTAQIICELGQRLELQDVFLSELIWREFYYAILSHFPFVETEAFLPKFRAIPWENRRDYFQAWVDGKTGYPIVDAGMRQLKETGWMHNRVRMIVASFLTKDLHIDYRWGENHFMKKLLDGDLGPNNGGWQWAASTGCDPQPYFRIFNPTLQGKRFDPDGEYVRRWIPELAACPGKKIHEPWTAPGFEKFGYPSPIVDHAVQARKALVLYSEAAK